MVIVVFFVVVGGGGGVVAIFGPSMVMTISRLW